MNSPQTGHNLVGETGREHTIGEDLLNVLSAMSEAGGQQPALCRSPEPGPWARTDGGHVTLRSRYPPSSSPLSAQLSLSLRVWLTSGLGQSCTLIACKAGADYLRCTSNMGRFFASPVTLKS